MRKDSPSGSTDYIYFGGSSIIAEKAVSSGGWTDYVFADGKRIVKLAYQHHSGFCLEPFGRA